jgi:glutaredoxin 3
MPHADIAVYQAEWCPFSARVRQKLTELGVPFVAMPVAAHRGERTAMEEAVGTQVIPVVVLGDGTVLDGDADDIVRELDERFESVSPDWAADHRGQAEAHNSIV